MKRVIFWCGKAIEAWGPAKINETGVGGSETAVIEIARRFASAGWQSDVFNAPGKYEGVRDGVGYWELSRLAKDTTCDLLVIWRNPDAVNLPILAKQRVLWVHDHDCGPNARSNLVKFDRVLGVSKYHADFLADAYDLPEGLVDFVPNGVNLDRFTATVKKVPQRCVYASSPDRGLIMLLKMWPEIIGNEKKPELHIGYGFDVMDKMIAAGRSELIPFKQECMDLIKNTKQVVYRGRLPQDELATLYQESVAWLYPSDFLETSCISAMEVMAAGCIPITSSSGALKETVGNGGLVVYGPEKTRSNPHSKAWREFYIRCVQGVLFESNNRLTLAGMAKARAPELTWDVSFLKWLEVVS